MLDPNTQLTAVLTVDAAHEALRWLSERRDWLGLDTETTGLQWWVPDARLRLFQMGDATRGFAIPADFMRPFIAPLQDLLSRANADPEHHPRAVLHNAAFDILWLRHHTEIDLTLYPAAVHDTLVMSRLADPLRRRHGLKPLSADLIDPRAGVGDRALKQRFRETGWDWATVPVTEPAYISYSALDPVLTARLAEVLAPRSGALAAVGTPQREVYDTERLTAVLAAPTMTYAGLMIDQSYVSERFDALGDYLGQTPGPLSDAGTDLLSYIRRVTADRVTRPTNDNEVRRFLLDEGIRFTKVSPKAADLLGTDDYEAAAHALSAAHDATEQHRREDGTLPALIADPTRPLRDAADRGDTTPEGFPLQYVALDKEVLSQIEHPVAEAILLYREQYRIRNTYLKAYATLPDDSGYLHPTIHTMQAVTGRSSISDPSMQNLPRSKHPRNAVVASPGHSLVVSDYAQIEARVFAHLSQDPNLLEAVRSGDAADAPGYDFHSQTARRMFHIPQDAAVPKDKRAAAKGLGFGLLYGAGDDKLALMLGVPLAEAAVLRKAYLTAFSGVERMNRMLEREVRENFNRTNQTEAYVEREGRRYYVAHPNESYRLTNYVTQGTAALVLKRGMLRLFQHGLGEWLRLPVHDEVILDVPDEHVEQAAHDLPRILTDRNYAAPLLADDAEILQAWGEKYD